MSYSCSDFFDDVTNEADRLGLFSEKELMCIGRSHDPALAADAIIAALRRLAKKHPIREGEQLRKAAPELLAALTTLVRRIERDNWHTTRGIKLAAARDAIAKATRRQK